LTEEDFVTAFNRRVYAKMAALGSGFDTALLGEDFTQEEISRIIKNTVSRQGLTQNGITVIEQCADKLRQERERQSLSLEELIASKRVKKQD